MTEGARQEVDFTLGGKTYEVRPTFALICAIERQLGESSVVIGRRVVFAQASVDDMAKVLGVIIRSADPKGPTNDQVGEMLMEEGLQNLIEPLGNFLTRSLRGNADYAKEAAAQGKADPRGAQ